MKEQKKQTKIMLAWTLAWVLSIAFLTGAVNNLWDNRIFTQIGLMINLAIGVGMIIANKTYLKLMTNYKRKFNLKLLLLR